MEMTGEGPLLGAGTRDGRDAQLLTLDDEPRVIAGVQLWNADEKVRESGELTDTSKNESASPHYAAL